MWVYTQNPSPKIKNDEFLSKTLFVFRTMQSSLSRLFKPSICDFVDAPIRGALSGDEPPPPPTTMFAYYFQFDSKYGISFHRATYLLNDLAGQNC